MVRIELLASIPLQESLVPIPRDASHVTPKLHSSQKWVHGEKFPDSRIPDSLPGFRKRGRLEKSTYFLTETGVL